MPDWEPFKDCTEQCAEAVPCPECGSDLPPKGRSVPMEYNISDCCERHRYSSINTRHLWGADELPGQGEAP